MLRMSLAEADAISGVWGHLPGILASNPKIRVTFPERRNLRKYREDTFFGALVLEPAATLRPFLPDIEKTVFSKPSVPLAHGPG